MSFVKVYVNSIPLRVASNISLSKGSTKIGRCLSKAINSKALANGINLRRVGSVQKLRFRSIKKQKNFLKLMLTTEEFFLRSSDTTKEVRCAVHYLLQKNKQVQFVLGLKETKKLNNVLYTHRLEVHTLVGRAIRKYCSYDSFYLEALLASLRTYCAKVNRKRP